MPVVPTTSESHARSYSCCPPPMPLRRSDHTEYVCIQSQAEAAIIFSNAR